VSGTAPASLSGLAERYPAALAAYLDAPGEAGLADAYEIGRQALDAGLGAVELAAAHGGAFEGLLSGAPESTTVRLVALAHDFLAEALAPFEMSLRGFRQANLRLASANEALERWSRELAAANTQLHEARAAAESERAQLAAVVASIGDGLFVIDHRHTVRLCNEKAADLLQTDPAGLIGHNVELLVDVISATAENSDPVRAFFARSFTHASERPRLELRTAGPPRRDLLISLFPVATPEGEGTGVLARDVTAERELDRTRDELVAVVSHELRGPLAAIRGYADLLLAREYDPETHRRLGIIHDESCRLGGLIDDFLDLQRLHRGADRIEPVLSDLRPLLEHAAEASPDPHHSLVIDLPANLPPVHADPERVWQVLVNLLGNARKYSPQGGEIRLRARASDDEVEVSVRDQGIGIPADALPRLFDEFYRVSSPEHEGITGTGLGLSISRKIIEAHGGQIWAESSGQGQGSCFYFTLPRSPRGTLAWLGERN